jgi:hypothetical protein
LTLKGLRFLSLTCHSNVQGFSKPVKQLVIKTLIIRVKSIYSSCSECSTERGVDFDIKFSNVFPDGGKIKTFFGKIVFNFFYSGKQVVVKRNKQKL